MATRDVHPLLVALVRHLPPPGTSWTANKRRRWLAALEANVGLIYEVIPSAPKRCSERALRSLEKWAPRSVVSKS